MPTSPGVVYIYLTATTGSPSSVQQKITSQIRTAREMGHAVTGMFFTTEPVVEIENNNIHWFQVPIINSGYFRTFRQHAQNAKVAFQHIKKTDHQGRLYFMRFGICNWTLLRLSHYLKGRIVFNHLSVETDEYALYHSDAGSRISRFLSSVEFKWLPIVLDKTLGKLIRSNSKGAVVNSEEIALRQKKKCWGQYPCEIIPDAVATATFPRLNSKVFGDDISMVFLKGASMDAEYNGLDRLMKGMAGYLGHRKFTLTIIGNHTAMEEKFAKKMGLSEKVFFKKSMYGNELNSELENYHLGVGPLAVHRKGIKDTSSIKTREFMARGLPFFIAHKDSELSNNPDCVPFHVVFEADESPIDLQKLEDFFEYLNKNTGYPEAMRSAALHHLDYRVKIPKWISFINR